MLWRDGRRSENVEDRRGDGPAQGGGGGFGGLQIPLGRGGVGGLGVVAIVVVAMLLGIDPTEILQGGLGGAPQAPPSAQRPAPQQSQFGGPGRAAAPRSASEEQLKDFVTVVLGDTEDTWHALFRGMGRRYEEPKLVLFTGAVQSACGYAQAAVGPFYCPGDRKVYIDLSFYRELRDRFGAPGDFAQAYVIAHEIGHHVQTILGIAAKVREAQRGVSRAEANQLSVRMELQADCFAGVWAHHAQRARQILEAGDIEEGLGAAAAIGDDRMQRQARGTVSPESFTHGSSAQRVRWFKRGVETGSVQQCDTFKASQL